MQCHLDAFPLLIVTIVIRKKLYTFPFLPLYRIDTTKTGHDLGAPQQRTVNSERERTLSATAVNVVRVLMHASFLWAACHDQQLELIVEVVKGVRPQDLAEFFWFHLVKDLECMQRSTGRGMDECVMIMHLVLKEILGTNPSICKYTELKYNRSVCSMYLIYSLWELEPTTK